MNVDKGLRKQGGGQKSAGLGLRSSWVLLPVLAPPRCVSLRTSRFWREIEGRSMEKKSTVATVTFTGLGASPSGYEPHLLPSQPWDPA